MKKLFKKLKTLFLRQPAKFDVTGERVDITYNAQTDFESLDVYQRSHYRRYEFAVHIAGENEIYGDFACGTGYGSIMLSEKATKVIGADINGDVITAIKKRYEDISNVEFIQADLLNLDFISTFDTIVSFETIEHFSEDNIPLLFNVFNRSIKPNGRLIFSTPYMQEKSEIALKMGHHLAFYINEEKIEKWLANAGFAVELYMYQNYETHNLQKIIDKKDFIICVAKNYA